MTNLRCSNRSVANNGEVVQWLKIKCLKFEKIKTCSSSGMIVKYECSYYEMDVRLTMLEQKALKTKQTEKTGLRKRKAEKEIF